MSRMVFLKLGGSLITDKDHANIALVDQIDALCHEIALAMYEDLGLTLILGHGSGSFGHHAAKKFNTRQGVGKPEEWHGFVEVASRARELNQIVVNRLLHAGLKGVSISPFSGILSKNHEILTWDTTILEESIKRRLIPVVYGDVVLDDQLGGTIFSTEEVFSILAKKFMPDEILLAGREDGIWDDFPSCTRLVKEINPDKTRFNGPALQGSASIDVTGGMFSKVEEMSALVRMQPNLVIRIFSGRKPGNLLDALRGIRIGTTIRNSKG